MTPANDVDEINLRRIRAAEHCEYAGDTPEPRAARRCPRLPEPGTVRAQALSRLAWVRWRDRGVPRRREPLRPRAGPAGPSSSAKGSTFSAGLRGWPARAEGSLDGIRYAEAGLQLAEQGRRPGATRSHLASFAEVTFWRTGRIRRDLLERAIELGRATGEMRMRGRRSHGCLPGRPVRGGARPLDGVDYERAGRADPRVSGCLMFRARMEVHPARGMWQRELCDQGIELAQQTGREMGESLCLMVLAEIDAYRGEAERREPRFPSFWESPRASATPGDPSSDPRPCVARALLRRRRCGWRLTAPLFADVTELDEVLAKLAGSVGSRRSSASATFRSGTAAEPAR